MKYTEFRKCVGHIVLDAYNALVAAVAHRTGANFLALSHQLIESFVDLTAYADQKRHVDTFKKPLIE